MLIKGSYTSVWDGYVAVITKVQVDTEDHMIEFLEKPSNIMGVDTCTREYVTLPWNPYVKKIDPNGDIRKDFLAFQEDNPDKENCHEEYFTYE